MVATVDEAKRADLLKQLQTIIAKDAVNGYLFQLAKIGVRAANATGAVQPDALNWNPSGYARNVIERITLVAQ